MAREKNIPKKTPTLTDKQQELAIKLFTRDKITDIIDITRLIFENDELDYRSPETRAVKKYLADNGHDGAPKVEVKEEKPKEVFELGFEHREFVDSNFPAMTMPQIFRILFPGNNNYICKEYKALQEYAKTVNPDAMRNQETSDKEYTGPSTMSQTIRLVNKVAFANLPTELTNAQHLSGIKALMKHIRAPRFLQAINAYEQKADRELFEAEYVRFSWDKPDLTAEELNLYVILCQESITLQKTDKIISRLDNQLNEKAAEEDAKYSMSLTETIKGYHENRNKMIQRITKLSDELNGKRKDRADSRKSNSRSIAMLVEKFMSEEEREMFVKMAKLRKDNVDAEVVRLSALDEMEAKIFGINADDITR